MRIHTVYSVDDGGWYCEVYDSEGKTLYTTAVHQRKPDAVRDARGWIAVQ